MHTHAVYVYTCTTCTACTACVCICLVCLQHPSLAIVKAAGLIMKAIIEVRAVFYVQHTMYIYMYICTCVIAVLVVNILNMVVRHVLCIHIAMGVKCHIYTCIHVWYGRQVSYMIYIFNER